MNRRGIDDISADRDTRSAWLVALYVAVYLLCLAAVCLLNGCGGSAPLAITETGGTAVVTHTPVEGEPDDVRLDVTGWVRFCSPDGAYCADMRAAVFYLSNKPDPDSDDDSTLRVCLQPPFLSATCFDPRELGGDNADD